MSHQTPVLQTIAIGACLFHGLVGTVWLNPLWAVG